MINIRKQLLFIGLVFVLMASSIQLIVHIYDYRVTFSEIEKFNKKYEDLSFKSNLLLNEVEYFRNQLTIREVATGKLGMRSPKLKEQVVIHRQVSKR
jgi:cell division protein FtsL|tara:strand:+ start:241 stop:531 length:291 start_codon:yes stop_codon:yes gene_type:complete